MKSIFLFIVLLITTIALKAQNIFPASGAVGIGTTSPASSLDINGGIDEAGTGRTFIAPYFIGYSNDVCGGQAKQYVLLIPISSGGAIIPACGLSGILTAYRGTASSYNYVGEYRLNLQSAYNDNTLTITPLTEKSRFLNIYQVTYQGVVYAALKADEILCASASIRFSGHWWNNVNGTRPRLVAESDVTASTLMKDVACMYSNTMYTDKSGNVGIGVTNTKGYKLAVAGSLIAERIRVKQQATWPDYVFHKDYTLTPLADLDAYIQQHRHLPEIPSAGEIAKDGQDLGEMNRKLLQKVEELTLYIISQDKKVKNLEQKVEEISARIK